MKRKLTLTLNKGNVFSLLKVILFYKSVNPAQFDVELKDIYDKLLTYQAEQNVRERINK